MSEAYLYLFYFTFLYLCIFFSSTRIPPFPVQPELVVLRLDVVVPVTAEVETLLLKRR